MSFYTITSHKQWRLQTTGWKRALYLLPKYFPIWAWQRALNTNIPALKLKASFAHGLHYTLYKIKIYQLHCSLKQDLLFSRRKPQTRWPECPKAKKAETFRGTTKEAHDVRVIQFLVMSQRIIRITRTSHWGWEIKRHATTLQLLTVQSTIVKCFKYLTAIIIILVLKWLFASLGRLDMSLVKAMGIRTMKSCYWQGEYQRALLLKISYILSTTFIMLFNAAGHHINVVIQLAKIKLPQYDDKMQY